MMRLSCFKRSGWFGSHVAWVLLAIHVFVFLPSAAIAGSTYTVKKGDSLTSISKKLGVSAYQLMRTNGIKNPDKISAGQKLRVPEASDKIYKVKKGDSISSISRRYGVSSVQLARHNGITNPNKIVVGMTLKIPGGSGSTAPSSPSLSYSSRLPSELTKVRVSSRWKNVVIHHSATRSGDVKGMDAYHRRRGMNNGLAYHFVIGNGRRMKDGEIALGNRWRKQINGGHLASEKQNRVSIGICLVGDFDKRNPTKRQMQSLHALVGYLMGRCHLKLSSVKTHQQINVVHTLCPGKHFPMKTFLRDMK